MSTERETTRIVRSWLGEGVTALPDRVLDAVLDQLPATPQRRSWWPTRRFAEMNRLTQALMAAAVVVVVAVVGYNVLPRSASSVGGTASPSPQPTAAPIPSGSMAPGFYRVSDPTHEVLPYTFTVPAGWSGPDSPSRGDAFSGSGVTLTTWIVDHVYGDGCHWSGTLVPVATRAQLVAALVAQKGDMHSTPVETTVGGLAATKITMSLDPSFDMTACNNDLIIRMWPDPGPDESGGWGLTPGETATVYAIEANGKLGVLMTVQHVDSPPADVAELQPILESVHFEQPTPSGS
jgi:hypothetical protein